MFPGPTILSTRRIVAVPYASAATACAPPRRQPSVTPARHAAASTTGSTPPPPPGGAPRPPGGGGRAGGHQDGRRVRRAPPGHVDADPVQRADLLAEDRAVLVGQPPRLRRRGGAGGP